MQIASRGNGYTSAETVTQYAMRKAAEETVADGYDLFLVLGSQDRTRTGSITTQGYATTNTTFGAGGATSHTTYSPGQTLSFVKPGETMTIKMLKGSKPENAPPNLFDAREVARFLTPPSKG